MANVKLFDQTGKEVSTVELNDAIFGIEPNESVVNHGVKKELDVLVKVLSAHHNGVVVVLSSDQLHVHTDTNFYKKFVALH